MAEDSAIDRKSLVSDDAFEAPLKLIKDFKEFGSTLDNVADKGKEFYETIGDTKSIKDLEAALEELMKDQNNLLKTQTLMSDKVKQLENENKKLTTQIDKLTKETEENTRATKRNSDAMEALDNRMGGAITRAKTLGKELLALAKSPVVLMLAALVGIFAALTSSVKTFFETTGEGEDMLARQTAVWSQFFNTLKKGWSDLGKKVSEFVGEQGSKKTINGLFEISKVLFPFLIGWITQLQKEFNKTADEAVKLAEALDALEDQQAENIIHLAETTTKYNKLIRDSQDDLRFSDEQRLAMLEEAVVLKRKQLDLDLAIARTTRDLLLVEIGLRHGLTKEETLALDQKQKLALFTGKEMKELAEATAKVIALEGTYEAEVRKASNAIIKLKKEIHEKMVKGMLDEVEASVQKNRDVLENAKQAIRLEAAQGFLTKKEAAEKIQELEKRNMAQLIQIQIDGLSKILLVESLTAEERIKIEKQVHDLKIKLNEALFEQIVDLEEVEVEAGMSKLESLNNIYGNFVDGIGSMFSAFNENRLREIDEEEAAIQESYDRRIEMAGDNIEKRKKLENELAVKLRDIERKRIESQRRAAIFEKAIGLVQAGINVGLAATNQGAKGDPYTALARVGAIVAALGPFVAMIASKDIPSYAVGTDYHKGGPARVGELGRELYRLPDGTWGLTPARTSVMNFPEGTQVIPADETSQALALAAMGARDSFAVSKEDGLLEVVGKLDDIKDAILNKEEHHWEVTERGIRMQIWWMRNRTTFKDKYYK